MSGLRGGWGGALGFPGVVGWCVPPALCAPHPGVSSPASLWAWAPGRASPPLAFSVRLHPPAASVPPGRACCAPTAAGDPGALRHGSHGRDASALPGQGAVTVLAALGPPPPGPAEVGAPAVAPMPPGHSCAPVTAGGGWRRPERSLGGCGFPSPRPPRGASHLGEHVRPNLTLAVSKEPGGHERGRRTRPEHLTGHNGRPLEVVQPVGGVSPLQAPPRPPRVCLDSRTAPPSSL